MRYRRGHPWLFAVAFGSCVMAFVAGDVVVAFVFGWLAWWLLVR